MAMNVLIFIAVILSSLQCRVYGKRSVAFVIDDTASMTDDIDQVKEQTKQAFDAILLNSQSKFDDFVLVTFNDPGSKVLTITNSSDIFKKNLGDIKVHSFENYDCPELSLSGIIEALNTCPSNSVIYVFTDATAKDFGRFEEVRSLSQKKSIQVSFLLTGNCSYDKKYDYRTDYYKVYYNISKATSGEVFNLRKKDLPEALHYIIESIKSERHLLADDHAECPLHVPFTVDGKTSNVMISVARADMAVSSLRLEDLTVVDSGGEKVETYPIMRTPANIVIKLRDEKIGDYLAKLVCPSGSNIYLTVTGSTAISFQHGFSVDKPTSIKETSTLPPLGQTQFLSIALDNPEKDIKLKTVELIDENDKVVKVMNLKLVDTEHQFYVTSKFDLPKKFKIKVIGQTKLKDKIERVGRTFIESKEFIGKIDDKLPEVMIVGTNEIQTKVNKLVTIKCRVAAYPQPKIVWESDRGEKFEPNVTIMDKTGLYKSVLEINNIRNNATYSCIAENKIGKDKADTNVYIIDEPPVIAKFNNITKDTNQIVQILCKITKGEPRPTIGWLKNNITIKNGKKYQIQKDNNILRFRADITDNGFYTCVAENRAGSDQRKVRVTINAKPVIEKEAVDNIIVAENELIKLQCRVKGEPPPTVRWFKNTTEIGKSDRFHVFSDHTLEFKATISDNDNFYCQANNRLGEDKTTFHIAVHVPVKVATPLETSISIATGGPLRLQCAASAGLPPPAARIIFIHQDIIRQETVIASLPGDKADLILPHVTVNHSGYYLCNVSNDYTSSTFTYKVDVKEPPRIVKETWKSNKYTAVAGDLTLRIPCKAQGNPIPTITWYQEGHTLLAVTDELFFDEIGTLVIVKPKASDSGKYICVASNDNNQNDTKTVNVEILSSPMVLNRPDAKLQEFMVEEGIPYTLKCDIPHKLVDLVRWFKDGKEISNRKPLSLKNPSTKDSGTYTCRVSNETASQSYHAKVVVGFKPRFINAGPAGPIPYVEGTDARLDCKAQAEPAAKITWTVENKPLYVPYMVLVIPKMKRDRIGVYTCTVTNSFGVITRQYQIKS